MTSATQNVELRKTAGVLECVINISEGRDLTVLDELATACDDHLLDVHRDADHNRSVFTLAGDDVQTAARQLTTAALERLDIRTHTGVHPFIGVVDVVPFVPLTGSTFDEAQRARNDFAHWLAREIGVPVFLYGPERSLPDVRKQAFRSLAPDYGPTLPHESAGASAVGVRNVLIAYNLFLQTTDVRVARRIARDIRGPGLRTLGLTVRGRAQVSCNLTDPERIGPGRVYDLVAEQATIHGAELVGLLPVSVLEREPAVRWGVLDISEQRTIEARLSHKAGQTP